jgi:hypothetical protein
VLTRDTYQLGLGTLEYDHGFGTHVTVIGTASLGRYTPESGVSVSDVIPALELDYLTPSRPSVRVIGTYTFKNDLDGEDDYEAGIRFTLGGDSAARVAVGKHGRITATFVQTLK